MMRLGPIVIQRTKKIAIVDCCLFVALGDLDSHVEVDQPVMIIPYLHLRKLVQKGMKPSKPKPKPLREFTGDVLDELKRKLRGRSKFK